MTATVSGWSGTRRGIPVVGASAERSKRIEQRDAQLFAQMTGDWNPLHFNPTAASASRFGGLIAHGGVTSGILNALVAEDLPGPGSVFLNVEWRFVKAVYTGDTITGRVEVTDVREDKPVCQLATTVRNQNGEVCLSGTATTYTVQLPPAASVSRSVTSTISEALKNLAAGASPIRSPRPQRGPRRSAGSRSRLP